MVARVSQPGSEVNSPHREKTGNDRLVFVLSLIRVLPGKNIDGWLFGSSRRFRQISDPAGARQEGDTAKR